MPTSNLAVYTVFIHYKEFDIIEPRADFSESPNVRLSFNQTYELLQLRKFATIVYIIHDQNLKYYCQNDTFYKES